AFKMVAAELEPFVLLTLLGEQENVADVADCLDRSRPARITFDPPANSTDVGRQVMASLSCLVRPPGIVQQLTPRDNPTGVFHQLPQDHELLARKLNRDPPDRKPVRIKVKLHVTNPHRPWWSERQRVNCWIAARPRSIHSPSLRVMGIRLQGRWHRNLRMILIGMARNLRHTCATKTALADSKVALPIGLGWLTRTLATMRELSHGQ